MDIPSALRSLFELIAIDYGLDCNELVSRYLSVRVPCVGFTARGSCCKNPCISGTDRCRLHVVVGLPPALPQKVARVPKPKKVAKVQPEHNHRPLETPLSPCVLCASHGDALDSMLPVVPFECPGLSERVSAIMAHEVPLVVIPKAVKVVKVPVVPVVVPVPVPVPAPAPIVPGPVPLRPIRRVKSHQH